MNALAHRYCWACGAPLDWRHRESANVAFWAELMRECIERLDKLGLDDEGHEMRHEATELVTAFDAWRSRPPADDEQRRVALVRALELHQRAMAYRA